MIISNTGYSSQPILSKYIGPHTSSKKKNNDQSQTPAADDNEV